MYLNVEVKMNVHIRRKNVTFNQLTHLIFWLIWAFSLHYNFIIITPYMRRLLPESEREFLPYGWLYKLYYLTSWNQVSDYYDDIFYLLLNGVLNPWTLFLKTVYLTKNKATLSTLWI